MRLWRKNSNRPVIRRGKEKKMNKIIVNPFSDALIAIDVQPTFMPGGGLPVAGGHEIVRAGQTLMIGWSNLRLRYATQDWHPLGHISLASSYVGLAPYSLLTEAMVAGWTDAANLIAPGARFTLAELKNYLAQVKTQVLWPNHGIEGTAEAELHPAFMRSEFAYILKKGMDPACDSYGAFEDNLMRPTGFADVLRQAGVKRCFFWGLALDYCVRYSAEGAARNGFEAYVIEDATRAVALESAADAKRAFAQLGIHLVNSDELELNILLQAGG